LNDLAPVQPRLQRWKEWTSDQLTVSERWFVFILLILVVMGTCVKYFRERPVLESPPPTNPLPPAHSPD